MQPGGEILELPSDTDIDVEDSTDAVWISQERLTLPTDQLKSAEEALEASSECVIFCKVSFDGSYGNGQLVSSREGTHEMCLLCILEGESRKLYARAYKNVAEFILGEEASADRTNEEWQVDFFF